MAAPSGAPFTPVNGTVHVVPGITEPVGGFTEIEVSWPDQFGHALGKRIPARRWDAVRRSGIAFCDGALAWNVAAEVQEGVGFTNWGSGYPDAVAHPDLTTLRRLPWRDGAGHVLADVTTHGGQPLAASPRAVLRRLIDQLAARGYTARVALELEFYLLNQDGAPVQDGVHCYSLDKADELDPALSAIIGPLQEFAPVEAVNSEYGPGQLEINLSHAEALTAADDAFRLRYGLRALARRQGLLATFMAKPFTGLSGSSAHVHLSLWRDGEPAFAPVDETEAPLTRHVTAGLLAHLPGITLYGSPTVNAYKRFQDASFAPTTAVWGGDNRTVAVRSLLADPAASRLEVRTPSADANPYWVVASVLAAAVAGIDEQGDPGPRRTGNLYGTGPALPATLPEAVRAARADHAVRALLGEGATDDFAALAESEWTAWTQEVTQWERDRYLRRL